MKKQTNPTRNSTCMLKISKSENLRIKIIGELLLSRTLTVEQINDGFHIRNASEIIAEFLRTDIVEEVHGSSPKAYRLKNNLGEWFL
jgi:hypothetical protein